MLPHAAIDEFLGGVPPAVTAALALAAVCSWQLLGASLLARIYERTARGNLGAAWAFLLGFATWLPVSGTVAMVFAMIGLGRPGIYRGVAAVIALQAVPAVRAYGRRWSWRWLQGPRWIWLVAGAAAFIQLMFSAHPQRQYDQLNYHLVVAKLLLNDGRLPVEHFDTPLFIAGPVEYAFIWLRAMVPSDLFEAGAAACWVYLSTLVTAVGAIALSARRVPQMALLAVVLLPAVLPDGEFVRIAKPNGALFAAALVILAALRARRELFVAIGVGLGLLMIAVNQTFVHAGIALLAAVLVVPGLRRHLRLASLGAAPGVVILGALCLVAAIVKSVVLTGTPLYPASAAFFPSPLANAQTMAFWADVAAAGETTRWSRFLGAPAVAVRSVALAACLLLFCGAAMLGRRRRIKVLWPFAAYVFAYGLAWPLFYGHAVYSRFVAAYLAGLVMIVCLAFVAMPARWRKVLLPLSLLLAMSQSGVDVYARKLWDWNGLTLNAAFDQQFARFATARFLNRELGEHATILADDPAKFFFDQRVLHSALSPREQGVWRDLLASPAKTAVKNGVAALVVKRDRLGGGEPDKAPDGPILAVWKLLEPYGVRHDVGKDAILLLTITK